MGLLQQWPRHAARHAVRPDHARLVLNEEGSIGAETLVAANDKLYGFWNRPEDKMGSPWNADKQSGIDGTDLGKCRAVLYPPV